MPKGESKAQSEAEETVESMELEVQCLKRQTQINRMLTSTAINSMIEYVTERMAEDHITTPEYPKGKKSNPWIERKKCSVL